MAYPESFQIKLRREFLRRTFRVIFHVLFRLKVTGLENVPQTGACIVAHNHVSIIEPALVLAFLPRRAEAIGAQELWTRRGQSVIIRLYGTMPVRRGDAQRDLIKKMLEVLNAGSPLLIAPEGTRSHVPGMGLAQPGIGYLLDQARVPVVPVAIVGSTDDNLKAAFRFKRPTMTMHLGTPFEIPPIGLGGKDRREARQKNADQVMIRIGAMLPEEYWGVYAEPIRTAKAP